MNLKHTIVDISPPFLIRVAYKLYLTIKKTFLKNHYVYGIEQPSSFYDKEFEENEHWQMHYSHSPFYSFWTVISDRIMIAGVKRILDVGCGSGQLACLLYDIGISEYCGIDFSPERIKYARTLCPEYSFVEADVLSSNLLETFDYDCILSTEFLEHIDNDLKVIERIRPYTTVIASVPNFPCAGHVRYFKNISEIKQRYGRFFDELYVTKIIANDRGHAHYLLQGKKKGEQ